MQKLLGKRLCLAGGIFILLLLLLQSCTYEQLIGWISEHYALSHTQSQKLQELFPAWRWHAVRFVVASCPALLYLLLPRVWQNSLLLIKETNFELKSILFFYQQNTTARYTLAVTSLGIGIWYAFQTARFPLPHIDEAFGYVHLIRRGVLVCMSYYPGPNHHVLYYLLAACFDKLLPAFWAIKLPTLLATVALHALLMDTALRKLRLPAATATLLAVGFHSIEGLAVYATLGRGYLLQCFWLMLALRTLPALEASALARRLFLIAQGMAFYTLPTHLYAYFALAVACGWSYGFQKRWVWGLHLQILCLTALLYLPFVLTQGVFFWQSPFIASVSHTEWLRLFPNYLWSVLLFLFKNAFITILWLSIGMIYMITLSFKVISLKEEDCAALCLIGIPWAMAALQGFMPPTRVWLFLALPFWWMLARLSTYKWQLCLLYALLALWLQLHNAWTFRKSWANYFALHEAIAAIPAETRCIETRDDWVYTTLLYQKHTKQMPAQVAYPPQQAPCPTPALCLMPRDKSTIDGSRLVYANAYFAVYEKN
ncbi:hypothetical protein FHS56_000454 [Thermonema lapsum]|uniref:Glycosyltransferase RgtA/B/C/D-like domain-containing protein n=1 Tax=Thermonema lapsum TaxID=28195 RepID=A0A846MN30_9BACT|nr:hypothetical protein [Thermonema lapsum]NIK72968.1 hypothetical protein [Thermonema lapsum]